jgi:hypothetical protein
MLRRIAYGMAFNYPCPRKLREIMKMSMIEREPPHKVKDIWKEYHNPRINNTATSLDKHKYEFLNNRYPSPHSEPIAPPTSSFPSTGKEDISNSSPNGKKTASYLYPHAAVHLFGGFQAPRNQRLPLRGIHPFPRASFPKADRFGKRGCLEQ